MTAYYDFFRYVKLYSPDGTTLEQTIEADNVTDSINFIRGKQNSVLQTFMDVFENKELTFIESPKIPKISIIKNQQVMMKIIWKD